MTGVVPGRGDVRKLRNGGGNHDRRRDGTTESSRGPLHGRRRRRLVLGRVHPRRVESSVEPKERNVEDPDPVEVHQQVRRRPLLEERLEEDAVPSDATELGETLRRGDIDKASLTYHE